MNKTAESPLSWPPSQATRRAVLRAREGWPLLDAVDWLAGEGRRHAELGTFTQRLCDRLVELDAPLWRVRLAYRTLHPQVFAQTATWTQGQPVRVYTREHGVEQTEAYLGSPIAHVYEHGNPFHRCLDELAAGRDHSVLFEIARAGGTDYLALPLAFSTGATSAVLIVVTNRAGGFEHDDLVKLAVFCDYLAPLTEVFSTRHAARSLLDTYVGPRTGERVLRGLIKRGDGEMIRAAMWFSDLRDFTALTENLSPADLLGTLNEYFELVAAAVTARGGEILRFIGDAMLIVFPQENQRDEGEVCTGALDAAQDAFSSLATVNHSRVRRGRPPIRFGVGLHVGEVIYGNVGAPNRLDFTVMGPAVNRTRETRVTDQGSRYAAAHVA